MISGLLVVAVVVLAAASTAATTAVSSTSPADTSTQPPTTSNNNNNLAPSQLIVSSHNTSTSSLKLISQLQQQDLDHNLQSQASNEQMKIIPLRKNKPSLSNIYTNQFVIQVEGGEEAARQLANKHGFVYLNHILADYYHLEHRRLAKRSTSEQHQTETLNISIQDEPQVLHLERQVLKRRVKRDFLELQQPTHQGAYLQARPPNQRPHQAQAPGSRRPPPQLPASHHHLTRPANQRPAAASSRTGVSAKPELAAHELLETSASSAGSIHYPPAASTSPPQPSHLAAAAGKLLLATQMPNQQHRGSINTSLAWQSHASGPINGSSQSSVITGGKQQPFNDPSWPLMWYLDGGAKNGFDLNVMAAWKMGYTGKGIVITILDDGLEKDHPDLQANYDPLASFDINGDDADPMPRYDAADSNRHGTRCAGEVAAVPDNNICSIGIAYNSKVGGVRMLDGDVTDAVEARSLGLNNQHIHIYSASWGPDDNGKTVDGPGELATRAFIEGVTNGRQGLGSIFVFASGNGGREHDNCNCDGYTNSIWTLSISSATENGYVPWYIEACSSTLATTYSSGSYEERQIATTDLHHSCTSSHTGTSASAPLAAGICALVLESNPRLTWRDMQHIVVRTAKPANLVAKDWRTNALGRNVSHAFGYGLMDAAAMITMAKRWTTVPVQYTCEVRSPQMDKFIPPKGYIELKLRAECANVRFLEHVQSKVTLTASRRGDLHIYLISPLGTRSTLLAQRPNDQAEQGFRNWPFMTVHSWGESPNGIWTLEVHNDGKAQNRAHLKEWTLILYGTYDDPNKHLDNGASSHNHNHQHSVPTSQHVPSPQPPAPVSNGASTSSSSAQRPSTPPKPPGPLPAQHSPAPAPDETTPGENGQKPPISHQGGITNNNNNNNNNNPSSHWSFTPPPPPVPGDNDEKHLPTLRPPLTSTYTTTFKTMTVSSGVSSQPGGSGNKADFDIVSPATQGSNVASTTTESPPTANNNNNNQDSDLVGDSKASILKPSVSQIDIAEQQPSNHQSTSENQLKQTTSTTTTQAPAQASGEIDANQIDSKLLTKDYRSSGDQQSIYEQQQVLASQVNQRAQSANQQQSSSSAAAASIQQQIGSSPLIVSFIWMLIMLITAAPVNNNLNRHYRIVRSVA